MQRSTANTFVVDVGAAYTVSGVRGTFLSMVTRMEAVHTNPVFSLVSEPDYRKGEGIFFGMKFGVKFGAKFGVKFSEHLTFWSELLLLLLLVIITYY